MKTSLLVGCCRLAVWVSLVGGVAVAQTETTVPMALDEKADSVWDYLQEKYDADADGSVSEQEYGRQGSGFGRLDTNGDGQISPEDFQGRVGRRGRMMRGMRGQRLMAMYLQVDQPDKLTIDELKQAAAAYDTTGDQEIDQAEFTALAEERKLEPPGTNARMIERMLRDTDPFDALLAAIDTDRNEKLSETELSQFFRQQDDGDDVWTFEARTRRGGRGGRASGVAAGQVAPDFTLKPLHGGQAVTLSSFKGQRPVALIFGSYT